MENVESFKFILKNTDKWDQENPTRISGDVLLVIDGVETQYNGVPKSRAEDFDKLNFELTSTLPNLFRTVQRLRLGASGLEYNFACGSCGETGCTKIQWDISRENKQVKIDMGDRAYLIEFKEFTSAVQNLFEKFIESAREEKIGEAEFYFPFSKNVESLEGLEELTHKFPDEQHLLFK